MKRIAMLLIILLALALAFVYGANEMYGGGGGRNEAYGNQWQNVPANIVPDANNLYLGSEENPWKGLYLAGDTLYLGDLELHDEHEEGGLEFDGQLHLHSLDGVASNVHIHEGTEPPSDAAGDGHRIWANASHDLMWQNHEGDSVIIHSAGGAGQWILTGSDISYSDGGVTIGSVNGINYAPGSDVNTDIFTVDVTPGPAGAPLWKFLFGWDGWSTNRKLNISQGGSGLWLYFADGLDNFGLYNRAGTPEANIAADTGSFALDTSAGAVYVKTSDTVNTGWEQLSNVGHSHTESQISDLDHFDGFISSLHGATYDQVAYGNAMGDGLATSATLTYNGSKLLVGDGGIELGRTGADPYLKFGTSGSGQIRADASMIKVTNSSGGTDRFTVNTATGAVAVNSIEIVGADSQVNKSVVEDSANWDAAYTHSQDNTQAHSDYLISESDPVFSAWTGDISHIYNSAGDLDLQDNPNWGNVELFDAVDVANNENGGYFYINRRAPEGNAYLRFYISASQTAFIHASKPLTLQAQQPFTINSVTDDIFFKVGDAAGAKKFYFRDSGNNNVAIIDSDGGAYFAGNVVIGTDAPAASAVVDIVSTAGVLYPPRMTTTQRDAISGVTAGGTIYNTTTNKTQTYDGTTWQDHW